MEAIFSQLQSRQARKKFCFSLRGVEWQTRGAYLR